MKRRLPIVLLIVFLFILVFLPLIILTIKKVPSTDIFSWSIFDLFELFITAIIGTLFGYYLSVFSPKQEKKKDIEASYITIILDDLTFIIKSIEQKKEKKITSTEERDILLLFRLASNDLNAYISDFNKNDDKKLTEVKNLLFELKAVITDEPFVKKQISFDCYLNAFDKYGILKSQLTFYKTCLYF